MADNKFSYRSWYGEKTLTPLEREALKKASFDDIAPIAIYLYADIRFKSKAEYRFKKLKKMLNIESGETIETVDIHFGVLYNWMFEEILEENDVETYVDYYGSYGFFDKNGNRVFGDDYGYYPYYLTKKLIAERLSEDI